MRIRRSGYTLVEILVACVLAVLVLGVVARIMWIARGLEQEVSASYLVRQDADVVFRVLQDDLRLTSLSTIRVADKDKGFSFASPMLARDKDSFEISKYGVAVWKSWVHYTVSPQTGELGNLVRWEAPYPKDTPEPRPSTLDPTSIGTSKESLLPGVVLPGIDMLTGPAPEGLIELGPAGTAAEGVGGLRVRFVRSDNTLSKLNPAQASDETQAGWSSKVTELVECQLQLADKSTQTGRWSIYTLHFRVAPRN